MLSETKILNRLVYKIFCPLVDETCPPEDNPIERRPVLFFLHGNGEHSGNLTIEQAIEKHGPLKSDSYTREAFGNRFIVAFPQLPAPGGNVWASYADDVNEIVRVVWNEYGGDPNRTYLTGFSYGGNGAFSIGSKPPRVWAALWPVDPTLKPILQSQQPVWLSLGERSRSEELSLQNIGFQEITMAGDNSNSVYIDYGMNHPRTATSAYRDKRSYNWLLGKQL